MVMAALQSPKSRHDSEKPPLRAGRAIGSRYLQMIDDRVLRQSPKATVHA